MPQTSNERVYSTFIDGLISEGKTDDIAEGLFQASVELRPFDRFSPVCDVRFGYVHGIDTFQLATHVNNFLQDGEKHRQGMFPVAFDTKDNTPWPPAKFVQNGRALHVTGIYFGKPFEAVITPL